MQLSAETSVVRISRDQAVAKATIILVDIMQYRRMSDGKVSCASSPCTDCLQPHLHKVADAILAGRPITFVLPAFPGKSPSPAKVLGTAARYGRALLARVLGSDVSERVRQRPRARVARIVLCSDGRVFSDAVGLRDEDVTGYQHELSRMIGELGLEDVISTFNLDDLYNAHTFADMRGELMDARLRRSHSTSLQERVRQGGKLTGDRESEEAHRVYCGITRFLVEDASRPDQTMSRTAIQKDARVRAYAVIQRSNAWSNLIAEHFADAVRLSIHPQTCGAAKLGIRLLEAETTRMTPWHGVAVEADGRFILLKRAEAEAMGASRPCSGPAESLRGS